MIRITDEKIEFQYPVDTRLKKVLNELSPQAFEISCITSDLRKLMLAIDSKYGKGCALKMLGIVATDIYTIEDINNAIKEIGEDE